MRLLKIFGSHFPNFLLCRYFHTKNIYLGGTCGWKFFYHLCYVVIYLIYFWRVSKLCARCSKKIKIEEKHVCYYNYFKINKGGILTRNKISNQYTTEIESTFWKHSISKISNPWIEFFEFWRIHQILKLLDHPVNHENCIWLI